MNKLNAIWIRHIKTTNKGNVIFTFSQDRVSRRENVNHAKANKKREADNKKRDGRSHLNDTSAALHIIQLCCIINDG